MARSLCSAAGRRRASSLAIALVLVAITAFTLVTISRTVVEQQRTSRRKHELSRAFYAAEAGVALVQHWGNFPADFTLNNALFQRITPTSANMLSTGSESLVDVSANPEILFPSLAAELADGEFTISRSTLNALNAGLFTSKYNRSLGKIREIQLLEPEAGDPVSCFFKIRSVGEGESGIDRTVMAYMTVSPVIAIRIPAALMSYNTAAAFGNARIHWGESWSKGNFNMLNRAQMDYLRPGDPNYDPEAIYRSEGIINFPNNWSWGLNRDLFDTTRARPGAAPASGNFDAFHHRLPAGTLAWPTFDYQTFKDFAKTHGRYYSTDAAGNIYRDGIEDYAHRVEFQTEFGVPDHEAAPYDLVFIDTIDNQPPRADGSNLSNVEVSGNGLGIKGIFWIGANFDASGIGSPPALAAMDPDGVSRSLDQIFMNGVIYTAGALEMSGNAGVYGSVITKRGFSGGGTPNVYYNSALADGLVLDNGNAGSVFKVVLQNNYGEDS